MSQNRNTNPYNPPARREGYIAARPVPSASGAHDDRFHPLHSVYRKRMRWVRVRWLGTGMLIGLIAGIFITLGMSIFAVAAVPLLSTQNLSGQPDISMTIAENYLNREVQNTVKGEYDTGIPGLTLTSLTLDTRPGNVMDIQPVFRVDVSFFGISTSATMNAAVSNQLSVQDGKLAVSMIGDPQLGNLDIPLDMLPFDLKGGIRDTVNRINNDVLIARINQSLEAGFGGTSFVVEGVATDENGLTVQLKQR